MRRSGLFELMLIGVLTALLAACGASTQADQAGSQQGTLRVVAAENFWGSIAAQLGGDHVQVTSIVTNPDTDPHDYEPTPADARLVADARYVILNGAGYDAWGQKLLAANPVSGRSTLDIGDLVGVKAGGNPHLWYNPAFVSQVIDRITSDYQALDPGDAAYFDQQRMHFLSVTLQRYHDIIDTITQRYAGTPLGSTESIFVYMAKALGLNLTTPPGFMDAVSEGNDIAAADKATFDRQLSGKQIKVLVYNKQNATPDTEAIKQKAESAGIPVVSITETLDPASATFQAWQVQQLTDLRQALARATGR